MSKTRILVVDDNWPVGKLVGTRLEQTGCFDVRVEHLPGAAARAAAEFHPQLFLLDVDMPGKNGLELAAELLREPAFARIPVIFLTSLVTAEEAGARELISQGKRYVSKAAPVSVLRQCIERALHGAYSAS
jgi:CheY-like chemotaxis protein